VYALKNAKDVPALKAVSQNLMHSNLSVTDGVYAILSKTDIKEQIKSLEKAGAIIKNYRQDIVMPILEQLLSKLKSRNTKF
jgi:hypothetical protein